MNLEVSYSTHLETLARSLAEIGQHITRIAREITTLSPDTISLQSGCSFKMAKLEMYFPKSTELIGNIYTDIVLGIDNVVDVIKMKVHLFILRFGPYETLMRMKMEGILGYGRESFATIQWLGLSWTAITIIGIGLALVGVAVLTLGPGAPCTPSLGEVANHQHRQVIDEEIRIPDEFSKRSNTQPIVITQRNTPPHRGPTPDPPHLVLLKYIHPTTSIWPPHYLQAFDRAQASQLSSLDAHHGTTSGSGTKTKTLTHMDTPPSANTRRQRDMTAKKWNGKIVLSKKGVRRDLREGKVGLRAGVKLGDGADEVVSAAHHEWATG